MIRAQGLRAQGWAVAALLIAVLCGCWPPDKPRPLAIVLWPGESDIVAAVESAGYRPLVVPLPCDGDLHCWAANAGRPGQFDAWMAGLDATIAKNGGQAVVVGISRGGYLALRASCLPGVRGVVALSPVTDLSQLREFGRVDPSYRLPRPCGPVYSAIGSRDDRVSTASAVALLPATVVTDAPGHNLTGVDGAVAWLRRLATGGDL